MKAWPRGTQPKQGEKLIRLDYRGALLFFASCVLWSRCWFSSTSLLPVHFSHSHKTKRNETKRNETKHFPPHPIHCRVKQLDNFKMKRRPLALRDGEIFGDESLAEIHRCRTKAKTMVKGASTDAMQAIMRSAPRRPETEEKRRDIKPNSNTIRSVEANFDNWKKFL